MANKVYTDEHIDFIRSIANKKLIKDICDEFNEKYGMDKKPHAISNLMQRNGIYNGLQGHASKLTQFKEGNSYGMNTKPNRTSFRKGMTPYNKLGDYSETVRDGVVMIKIGGKWRYKHRYIWEQAYGEIPKGKAILFKDNDKSNVEIDNLFMTTDQAARLVPRRYDKDALGELMTVAHTLAELDLTVGRMERNR